MIRGQAGFGILQVIMAIGATSALSYLMLQQSDVSNKQSVKFNFDTVLESQLIQIQTELTNIDNCTASFRGKKFGTAGSPTNFTNIYKGIPNPINPQNVIQGLPLFSKNKPNSVGIYISDINLLTRTEKDPSDPTRTISRDVLRVGFVHGDIDSSGNVRGKGKALGATSKNYDFFIQSKKLPTGEIVSCYGDNTNVIAHSCQAISETVWNSTTKDCEFPNAIKRTELIPLWAQPDGGVGTVKPGSAGPGTQPVGYLVKPAI